MRTLKSARGRGLCSEVMRHYQSIAEADGLPKWLEAVREYTLSLYQKHGFVVVDERPLSKRRGAADGL